MRVQGCEGMRDRDDVLSVGLGLGLGGWRLNPPARGVSLRWSLRPTVLNHDFRGLIHKNYIGNHVTMIYFHFRATCNNVVSENLLIKKKSSSSFFHGVPWGRSPHDPRGGAVTIPVRTNMTWLSTSQTTDAVADFFVSTHHGAPGVGSLVVDLPASSSHSQWRVGSTGDPQPGV